MNYYLVKVKTTFVGPRGDFDDGGMEKEVCMLDFDIKTDCVYTHTIHTYKSEFLKKLYENDEALGEVIWLNDDEMTGSEDGYNSSYHEVEYIKITEEQFKEYGKIIENYEML